ncbi:hypothetical protein L1987_88946 [Smallanthus sonchifolius]|nr:hypothetical protein L1987_88946 [Smallanthus sonchifolius]
MRMLSSPVNVFLMIRFSGAGAATIASAGAAIGIGNVLSSSIHSVARNPSLAKQSFGYAILGFALTEAIASFAPMMAFLISSVFRSKNQRKKIGSHTWSPDAMEGPTPVSALIHAATMVTAGVFMIARCSPLFEYPPTALIVINFCRSYDVIPCGNHWNITERSKEGHSLFNLQSIRLYDLCLRHL